MLKKKKKAETLRGTKETKIKKNKKYNVNNKGSDMC